MYFIIYIYIYICLYLILYIIYNIYNIYMYYVLYNNIYNIYNLIWYIYTRFSPLVWWGESPRPAKNLLIPLLLTKFLFLREEKSIQPNRKIKTSFLAVVIAPPPLYHFCFNFILFWNTDHASFEFNWCSVFKKCYF